MAKVFNGRSATEEYMSTHTLTFSTPDMTLRKFAIWLGEQVSLPNGERGPRLMLYLEERGSKEEAQLVPDVDESFKPSGAPLDRSTLEPETKFCITCGNKLKVNAKFCTKCGSVQG